MTHLPLLRFESYFDQEVLQSDFLKISWKTRKSWTQCDGRTRADSVRRHSFVKAQHLRRGILTLSD